MAANHTRQDEPAARNRILFLALLAFILVGGWLRFSYLNEPVDGYHSMNEAWYMTMAHNFGRVSLFTPTAGEGDVDSKVRALYVYTVYAASKIFGDSPAVARGVSAFAGVASILLLFLIGRQTGSAAAGLAAAALLAVSPIHTIVSRNAQPDAMCTALTLLTIYLYLKADGARPGPRLAAAGLVWGAAVFTKNFALLLLPAVVFHELVQGRLLKNACLRIGWFLLPALIVPAPFLIYQLMHNPAGMFNLYAGIVLAAPDSPTLQYMISESMWALSPFVFGLALAGLIWTPATRFRSAAVVWSAAFIFSAQYFFQHVHSYYFLSATPFLVLCAAMAITGLSRKTGMIVAGVALLSSLVFTVLCYAAIKHDFDRFSMAGQIISSESRSGAVLAPADLINNYGPVLQYYLPGFRVLALETIPVEKNAGRLQIPSEPPWYMIDYVKPGRGDVLKEPQYETFVDHSPMGFCVGTRIFYMLPRGAHSFIPARFGSIPARGQGACLGYAPVTRYHALRISRVPPQARVLMKSGSGGSITYIFETQNNDTRGRDK